MYYGGKTRLASFLSFMGLYEYAAENFQNYIRRILPSKNVHNVLANYLSFPWGREDHWFLTSATATALASLA